jgi:uncharacterized membrane protein
MQTGNGSDVPRGGLPRGGLPRGGQLRGGQLRGALAGLFAVSGLIHLILPGIYLPVMPPFLPYPVRLILLSGVAEIASGVGLLFPPTCRAARYGLIALLVAVFPANIQMAVNGFSDGATPFVLALLLARLLLQPLLFWLVYHSDAPARALSKSAAHV